MFLSYIFLTFSCLTFPCLGMGGVPVFHCLHSRRRVMTQYVYGLTGHVFEVTHTAFASGGRKDMMMLALIEEESGG